MVNVDLEMSICPVCGGSPLRRLFNHQGYAVCECAGCSLRLLNPQPDDARLKSIYSADYFIGKRTPQLEAPVTRLKQATAGLYMDMLAKYLNHKTGRLLEVGCGEGDFLLVARSRGFDVSGIDISPNAVAMANRRLGIESVMPGTLDNLSLDEGVLDAVVFFDVIEHVRHPMAFLQHVYRLLKPGATVFIITPSLDSWSARVMGRYWMEYKVEHLYYFSRRSVRQALHKAGFVQVMIEPNRKVLSYDYIYHHFQRYPVSVFTSVVRAVRQCMPSVLAYWPWRVLSSGIAVIAKKPD